VGLSGSQYTSLCSQHISNDGTLVSARDDIPVCTFARLHRPTPRPSTPIWYVRETIESLAHHGWDRVVVVNGHGGNIDALRELCGRVSRDGDAYAVPFTWFNAVSDPEMGHGGPVETSLLRHAHPELVHEDRLDAAAAGAAEGWGEWVSGVNLAYDSAEFTENGVVGDPRESGAERGEKLLDEARAALVELLDRVATRDR